MHKAFSLFKITIPILTASLLLLAGCQFPGGAEGGSTSTLAPLAQHNIKDYNNGFFYQVWDNDKGNPTLNYSNQAGGRYTLKWKGTVSDWNFVCGKGWNPAASNRIVEYSGTFKPDAKGSDHCNSYLDFYGWANNYRMEYYVLESYGEYNPSKDSSYKHLCTYTSNNATYCAYYKRQKNQPTPLGQGDFDQIYSIRTRRLEPGAVRSAVILADHVEQWKKAGCPITSQQWQIMATEGYGAVSGSSDITVAEGAAVDTTAPTDPTLTMTASDWIDIDAPYYSFHGYKLTFNISSATDNRAVTFYYLYKNGKLLMGGNTYTGKATFIVSVTKHGDTFSVRAQDAAGNYSLFSNSVTF